MVQPFEGEQHTSGDEIAVGVRLCSDIAALPRTYAEQVHGRERGDVLGRIREDAALPARSAGIDERSLESE